MYGNRAQLIKNAIRVATDEIFANRPMTDQQRKAMFARQGGGHGHIASLPAAAAKRRGQNTPTPQPAGPGPGRTAWTEDMARAKQPPQGPPPAQPVARLPAAGVPRQAGGGAGGGDVLWPGGTPPWIFDPVVGGPNPNYPHPSNPNNPGSPRAPSGKFDADGRYTGDVRTDLQNPNRPPVAIPGMPDGGHRFPGTPGLHLPVMPRQPEGGTPDYSIQPVPNPTPPARSFPGPTQVIDDPSTGQHLTVPRSITRSNASALLAQYRPGSPEFNTVLNAIGTRIQLLPDAPARTSQSVRAATDFRRPSVLPAASRLSTLTRTHR